MGRQKKKKLERAAQAKLSTTHGFGFSHRDYVKAKNSRDGPESFYVPLSRKEIDIAKRNESYPLYPIPSHISREYIAQLVARFGGVKETREKLSPAYTELSAPYNPQCSLSDMLSVTYPETGQLPLPAWEAPYYAIVEIRHQVIERMSEDPEIRKILIGKEEEEQTEETIEPIVVIEGTKTQRTRMRRKLKATKAAKAAAEQMAAVTETLQSTSISTEVVRPVIQPRPYILRKVGTCVVRTRKK